MYDRPKCIEAFLDLLTSRDLKGKRIELVTKEGKSIILQLVDVTDDYDEAEVIQLYPQPRTRKESF